MAEDQPEYRTVTAAMVDTDQGLCLITRWRLDPEELEALASGEDLYLVLCTRGQPVQPFSLCVGVPEWAR